MLLDDECAYRGHSAAELFQWHAHRTANWSTSAETTCHKLSARGSNCRGLCNFIWQFKVDRVLRDNDIELSLITLNWFLTNFSGSLHPRLLLRVWDVFFYQGTASCSNFEPDQAHCVSSNWPSRCSNWKRQICAVCRRAAIRHRRRYSICSRGIL